MRNKTGIFGIIFQQKVDSVFSNDKKPDSEKQQQWYDVLDV